MVTAESFPVLPAFQQATAIVRPSGLYSTPHPFSVAAFLSRETNFLVAESKIMVSSKLFAATVKPSRLNATPRTLRPGGAGRVWRTLPVAASQITALPSSWAVTSDLPSGLNATSTTWVPAWQIDRNVSHSRSFEIIPFPTAQVGRTFREELVDAA